MTFWGIWGHFEDQLGTWGLRTLGTFWGLFEDLRTWCSQNIEEPSWNFWWLLVDLLRTWGLWGIKGLFRTLRIFANLTTYWGIEDVDKFLRTLWTIWVSFEDLRPEDVGDLFVHFPDLLRTLWTFWGLFEDLRTWVSQNVEELFRTFCWFLVDLLRTVFRNFWELFEDHLMNIWGTFADHRILKTLITFWGLWCRLEYLLWTYEDFEGFDDLLRNLRTFWGSVENLRSEDLGYLLCIFLTFWGLCGPFEDFLKTWGPDALKTLKNFSGPFDDFLWTILRTVFRKFWGLCEDHLMTIWGTFDDHRILRTLITFWGIEVALITFCGPMRTSRALMTFWGIWGHFEDQLRTWGWGPWVPFVHFLDFLRTLWTFEDFLKTWGPDALRTLKNLPGTFDDFLWTIWGLFLGTFEDFVRTILRNFWRPQDFEDVDNVLRNWGRLGNLLTSGLRGLWWPFEEFEDTFWGSTWVFEEKTWGPDALRTLKNLPGTFDDFLWTYWGPEAFEELKDFLGHWGSSRTWLPTEELRTLINFWGLCWRFEYLLRTWGLRTLGRIFFLRTLWTFWGLFETWGPDALRTLKNLPGTFDDFLWTYWGPEAFEELKDFSGHWGSSRTWLPTEELRTLINFWGLCGRFEYLLRTWGLRTLGNFLCIFLTFWGLCGRFEDFLKTWGPEYLKTLKNFSGPFADFLWTFWELYLGNFETFWGPFNEHLRNFCRPQDFEDADNFLGTLMSPWIPFVDLWGLRGLWWPFEEFEDILRISWEPEVWGPWVPFVHFLDLLRTLWTFWGLFEDLRTWCSQNVEELFRTFCWLLVDLLRTVFRKFWGLCEDHLMTIWRTFDDHRILRTLITFWGIEVDLITFCGPMRTSRALRTFWGVWGHFEDQLRTWGLRTLGTFCAFSWLFEDFVDFLRTFWRPEDLMLSEHWRTFLDLLMTSCGPFEDCF